MILGRLLKRWRQSQAIAKARTDDAPARPATLVDGVAAAGRAVDEWCRSRRKRRVLHSSISIAAAEALTRRDPTRTAATIAAAERVLQHEFDLLGSGPFVPVDPDRASHDAYQPIDWYVDPVRRLRFPRGVPHKQWNLLEMRPGNADVKYPWELARCQHWATLAQAFRLTGDDRFAIEVARELDDFVEANPVGIGVNWTCTMDVGLRVVSWAIALELIADSSAVDDACWRRACEALFDHAVFIRDNLENTYEVTSNHFLSNLLGLQFAASMFDDLPQGAAWDAFAREALEREMDVQVLPDGADYESSVPYHRLVAELFLGAARLAEHRRAPFAPAFRARLRDMIGFLAAVMRPDGLMPQVGDADDGRLHVFEGYATRSPQDPRHLFGPAAAMFDEPSWAALGGDTAAWEAAWWGLEMPDATRAAEVSGRRTVLFPHAGVAVCRGADAGYLLITNGIVGTNGFGNHKHNDLLSFEYHHEGVAWIVDPGSCVYTSDPDARNRFRSTRSHNTLTIDDVEQNEMRSDWLFRTFEKAKPETMSFTDAADSVDYVGRHHGYERLPARATHTRTFRYAKGSGDLAIVDRLDGTGSHKVCWHFHLGPGVEARRASPRAIDLTSGRRRRRLLVPSGLEGAIVPAAYSPSYGVTVPCLAIELSAAIDLDGSRDWTFELTA